MKITIILPIIVTIVALVAGIIMINDEMAYASKGIHHGIAGGIAIPYTGESSGIHPTGLQTELNFDMVL